MGDPSFVAGRPYDIGSSTNNGTVIKYNPAGCDPFADRIASYCDAGDPYCASGNDMDAHHAYMNLYGTTAANWVVNKYEAWTNRTAEAKQAKAEKKKEKGKKGKNDDEDEDAAAELMFL